jgi:hypothetical protein
VAFPERLHVETLAGLAHQIDSPANVATSKMRIDGRNIGQRMRALLGVGGAAFEKAHRAGRHLDRADEVAATADRPGDGGGVERECLSISSISSNGLRLSRSSLLMKVMIGISRRRQTSNSLRVRASMPLAASITITAASTAVSVR